MSWRWFEKPEAKKAAVAVGAISVVAVCTWVAWRNFRHRTTAPAEIVNVGSGKFVPRKRLLKGQVYWEAINHLKPSLAEEMKNGRLTKTILIGINKAMILLVQDDFLYNHFETRKIRRNFMNDPNQYYLELTKGKQINEELLKEGVREVVRDLGMDEKFYEQQSTYICSDDPNVAYLSIFLIESLKAKIESKNHDLKKEALVAYFDIQTDNFDKYNFKDLGVPIDVMMTAKQNFMSDLASLQLKVEEEDLLQHKLLLTEPEVIEASKRLDEKVYIETQKVNRFSY